MVAEGSSLVENEVFTKVSKADIGKRTVGSRWVYALKYNSDGSIAKFKARIVAKGYTQVRGVDYNETYCSVVDIFTTRLVLAYAAARRLKVRQFDIKTAFLYGLLHELVFMEMPDGWAEAGFAWKLNRSLYGLKQSPRQWSLRFTAFLKKLGLTQSSFDSSLFFKLDPLLIIIVYVDDGLIFAQSDEAIEQVLSEMEREFQMRQMDVTLYRGLEITLRDDGIFIHQSRYIEMLVEEYGMLQSRGSTTPYVTIDRENGDRLDQDVPFRSLVGSLAYLADTSRPDIAKAVNVLSRKVCEPTVSDWIRAIHVLRYLKLTIDYGILYRFGRTAPNSLSSYSDSDYGGDFASAKSTTGYVILFNEQVVHWKCQLQRNVSLSSTESEIYALCTLAKVLSWVRRMLIEIEAIECGPALLLCDNKSTLQIVSTDSPTRRTRHLRAQDAYVYEQISLKELEVKHVPTKEQMADFLTKPLGSASFARNRDALMSRREPSAPSAHLARCVAWRLALSVMLLLMVVMVESFTHSNFLILKKSDDHIVHGQTVKMAIKKWYLISPCEKFKTEGGFNFHDKARETCQEWYETKFVGNLRRLALTVGRRNEYVQPYSAPSYAQASNASLGHLSANQVEKRQVLELAGLYLVSDVLSHLWWSLYPHQDPLWNVQHFKDTYQAHDKALKGALDAVGIVNEEVKKLRDEYSSQYYHLADTSLAISVIMGKLEEQSFLIEKVIDSVSEGKLDTVALSRLLNSTDVLQGGEKYSSISSMSFVAEDIIEMEIVLVQPSKTAVVLEINPISHWVDLTNERPRYVTFSSDSRLMLYDFSIDCAKLLLVSDGITYQECGVPNWRDPKLDSWKVMDNVVFIPETKVVAMGERIFVYCYPGWIRVNNQMGDCAPSVMEFPLTVTFFTLDGMNYTGLSKSMEVTSRTRVNDIVLPSLQSSNDSYRAVVGKLRLAYGNLTQAVNLTNQLQQESVWLKSSSWVLCAVITAESILLGIIVCKILKAARVVQDTEMTTR